jgi:hypothetical protein
LYSAFVAGAKHSGKTSQIELRVSKTEPVYFSEKIAGWSSLVARQAHNLKVEGSNPSPATNFEPYLTAGFFLLGTSIPATCLMERCFLKRYLPACSLIHGARFDSV